MEEIICYPEDWRELYQSWDFVPTERREELLNNLMMLVVCG